MSKYFQIQYLMIQKLSLIILSTSKTQNFLKIQDYSLKWDFYTMIKIY